MSEAPSAIQHLTLCEAPMLKVMYQLSLVVV